MKSCRFRLARDEKPIGFSWHTNFEDQRPVRRLLNLLNPSVPQNRSDLFNHLPNIRCLERHQLSGVYEAKPLTPWKSRSESCDVYVKALGQAILSYMGISVADRL